MHRFIPSPSLKSRHCTALVACLLAIAPSLVSAQKGTCTYVVASLELNGKPVNEAPATVLPLGLLRATTPSAAKMLVGQRIEPGLRLVVPEHVSVKLLSTNNNSHTFSPNTTVVLDGCSDQGEIITLESGKAFFDIRRALSYFNVRHDKFLSTVRGTRYAVEVEPKKLITFNVEEGTVNILREGQVRIEDLDKEATMTQLVDALKAGQSSSYRLDIDEYLAKFGNYGQALDYYKEQLAKDRASGDTDQLITGLTHMGIASNLLSRFEESISYDEEALALSHKRYPSGVHADIAMSLNNLGVAYRDLGGTSNLQRAIDYYEQSLAINRQLIPSGVHMDIAASLNNLGNAYDNLGDSGNSKRAIAHYEQSLTIKRQLFPTGVHEGIASSLNNLGNAYRNLGGIDNIKRAIDYYEQSLAINRQLIPSGVHQDIAGSLNNLGNAYRNLGGIDNIKRAIDYYEQSLAIRRQLFPSGVHLDIAGSLNNLGNAYDKLGGTDNLKRAIDYYEQELVIVRAMKPLQASTSIAGKLGTLSYCKLLTKDFTGAQMLSQEAIELAPGKLWLHTNLAHAVLLQGQFEKAFAIYSKYKATTEPGRSTFRQAVLNDFKELREAGVSHPDFERIEAFYQTP
jgi:tetratricopeptide (TPR) repeat protein